MANGKGGYAGKIGNSGVQNVKAPYGSAKKGKGTVRTGEDLRTGKK